MERDRNGSDFDWVVAQAQCMLPALFALLMEGVDSDVKRARGIRPGVEITCHRSDTKIVVQRQADPSLPLSGVGPSIVFELLSDAVAVSTGGPSGRLLFTARPILDVDRMCRWEIVEDNRVLEMWQVRRRALRELFFGD